MSQTLVRSRLGSEPERAYVMINCEDGSESYVIEQLKDLDGVMEVTGTVGPYDIIVGLEAISTEVLKEIITSKIRKISQVRSTTTIVCRTLSCF
ncbi:MAG: Lrp/AsnC ligand binding domain-containing protein [Nitrosotalea sp.]